jgi:predicted nucleic acid-binding Zn ribbon protein
MSGNTCDMVQWSDTKCVTPMMESVSPVLKCPVCAKYFFYNRNQIVGKCNAWGNSSWGRLSYKSLKEALGQLQPQGKDEITLRIMLLQGFNDYYGGCFGTLPRTDAPADERKLFDDNARRLLKLIPENKLFCAEICRELGEFDKSLDLLNDVVVCDPHIATIAERIRERASRRDSSVFIVAGCGECERTAIKDENMIVYKRRKDIARKNIFKRLVNKLADKYIHDDTEEF